MVDISKLVYAQLKERPEFAWLDILEAMNEQFEKGLTAITTQLSCVEQQLAGIQGQLTQAQELVTVPPAPKEAEDFPAAVFNVEIQDHRKQGARVITAPQPAIGGYRAVLDHFLSSDHKLVIVDMKKDDRHSLTVYDGFKRHIGPEDHIGVHMRRGDVILEKEAPDPQPAAPARKAILDRAQLERLPKDKRTYANGRFCQLPGCGMPLIDHQRKYCSRRHFAKHREYMQAHGIDRQTVEPISCVPEDISMRGITVVCGEAIRASRQSDGGPGSDRELSAVSNNSNGAS